MTSQKPVINMNQPKDAIIRIDVPSTSKSIPRVEQSEINILCFNITPYSELTQFLCCSVFVFICYLAYGYFLEYIFSNADLKPISLYITLVQFLITMALSYFESLIRNPIKRKWVWFCTFCSKKFYSFDKGFLKKCTTKERINFKSIVSVCLNFHLIIKFVINLAR